MFLNALTEAFSAFVAYALFETLDRTTRRARLSCLIMSSEVFLSDTVVFVQSFPAQILVEFHTTLDEVVDAYLILHVVDASHPGQVVRWIIQAVDIVVE